MSIDKVDFTIHRIIIFCDDTTLTNLQDSSSDVTLLIFLKWHKNFLKH